ncbi:CHAD domain-containing protein [Candidatus Obscuribacterales bacterium]|nr:CHAD domain-containing protein [Candidatus Obscuribacterales bacterium]
MVDKEKARDKVASKGGDSAALSDSNFLDFQIAVAGEAVHRLWISAKKLNKKKKSKSAKRVHNMRVAFRRWYSIWNVLSKEGFKTKSYKKKVGAELKKGYKLLGAVRDWDVNLNTGKDCGVPEQILAKWQHERNRVEEETTAALSRIDMEKAVKRLSKFLKKRAEKLKKKHRDDGRFSARPRDAIESYLRETEAQTRYLATNATSLEELHALRLSIKTWRYILVEFFGHEPPTLVAAQQTLGQINDLERVRLLLMKEDGPLAEKTIQTVVAKQQELLSKIDEIKLSLPFGLRPVDADS